MKLFSGLRSFSTLRPRVLISAILSCVALGPACGAGGSATGVGTNNSTGTVPAFAHVVVVVEENASYSEVIGSSAMPYLNSLATQYGLATQYFGNVHPSIGNYLMMTTGAMATTDDNFTGTISDDNLARQFATDNKTWKVYAEGVPSAGYLGTDTGFYIQHHNPFSYFSDVTSNPTEAANIVPFSKFSSDVGSGALPNFALVVPNSRDDAHDCPGGGPSCTASQRLAPADAWLQANIAPLIASSQMANTLLVITFDEGDLSDTANGGGHIATVIVSQNGKPGYKGTTTYQHQNLLRTIGEALRLSHVPGEGQSAGNMGEFF
jgi:acid phosphatase